MTAALDPAILAHLERLVDERVDARLADLDARLTAVEARTEEALARLAAAPGDKASIMVFSGDLDRLMSAFIVANGAVAMGLEVAMYFTFWGLVALKKGTAFAGKTPEQKMMAAILPRTPRDVGTSRLNMLGLGPQIFKRIMGQSHVESLPDLIALARELGVRLVACQMAMGVMGIRPDELIDGVELGGVATYLGDAAESKVTLFI